MKVNSGIYHIQVFKYTDLANFSALVLSGTKPKKVVVRKVKVKAKPKEVADSSNPNRAEKPDEQKESRGDKDIVPTKTEQPDNSTKANSANSADLHRAKSEQHHTPKTKQGNEETLDFESHSDQYAGGVSQWREECEELWDNWDWPPQGWFPNSWQRASWDPSSSYYKYNKRDWEKQPEPQTQSMLQTPPTRQQEATPVATPSIGRTESTESVGEVAGLLRLRTAEQWDESTRREAEDAKKNNNLPEIPNNPKTPPSHDDLLKSVLRRAPEAQGDKKNGEASTEDQPQKLPDNGMDQNEKKHIDEAKQKLEEEKKKVEEERKKLEEEKKKLEKQKDTEKKEDEKTGDTGDANKKEDKESKEAKAMEKRRLEAHARYMRYYRNIRSPKLNNPNLCIS